MYINKFIKFLKKNKPLLFTTPGHSQGFYSAGEFKEVFGKKVFKGDFSEVKGMDNLQNPTGIIKKSLERTAEIYGCKASFYLVNGSSSGIIALILATVKTGEKILISRNTHKSIINALVLSRAFPVWVEPEWDENWNIPGAVNPEKIAQILRKIPDIKAVMLTNPTYEGVITDIKSIAELCGQKNIPLLVDEAHGALWNFSERLPISSIHLGADACAQSLHKTGSCLNQGALLHISENSKLIPENAQRVLNIINTTSPSYALLSSIEASIEYLNSKKGREKLDELLDNIEETKKMLFINAGIDFLEDNDPTKLFFKLKYVNGQALSDFLQDKFNIEVELNNDRALLALTGIGTDKTKLEKLAGAIAAADKKLEKNFKAPASTPLISPQVALSPSEAFYAESEAVELCKAVERISAETIVTYPPGIPLVIAGETIQPEHLKVITEKKLKILKNFQT